jgi:hypothetical protein
MERAAKLPRLTKEEIRQRREEEYGPRGRAIAQRFLGGELAEKDVDAELAGHGEEEGEIVREVFLATLCRSIELEHPDTLTRALQGIRALVRDDRLEEASQRLDDVFGDYREERRRALAGVEETESATLRDLGVSGSAIRLDLEPNERWGEKRAELMQRFDPRVEEIKKELSGCLDARRSGRGGAGEDGDEGD